MFRKHGYFNKGCHTKRFSHYVYGSGDDIVEQLQQGQTFICSIITHAGFYQIGDRKAFSMSLCFVTCRSGTFLKKKTPIVKFKCNSTSKIFFYYFETYLNLTVTSILFRINIFFNFLNILLEQTN